MFKDQSVHLLSKITSNPVIFYSDEGKQHIAENLAFYLYFFGSDPGNILNF